MLINNIVILVGILIVYCKSNFILVVLLFKSFVWDKKRFIFKDVIK